jgi:hypothetical protein
MPNVQAQLEAALEKLESTSPVAISLLADPLSKLTRSRQRWLLLVGLLGILLSKHAIVLNKSTVVGITFTPGAQTLVIAVLALVAAYWALVFSASLYQDLALFRYKILPQRVQLARLTIAASQDSDSALSRALAAQQQHTLLMNEMTALAEKPYAALSEDERERLLKIPVEMQVSAEEVRACEVRIDTALREIILLVPGQKRIQRLRLFIEAMVPLAIGLYSVYLAVRR